MNVAEIRRLAIESSERYFKFLIDNQLGEQMVRVLSIEYFPEKHIKIALAERLRQIEYIFFRVLTTGSNFGSTVKIQSYDWHKNILYIVPDDEIIREFQNLNAYDLAVVSDLKFLVKNVRQWYIDLGSDIQMPDNTQIVSAQLFDPTKMSFIEGCEPSDEQRYALSSVLTSPFSYVWGPPGSGKTQFVLAYAVMHYIRQNQMALICAPTNNALEQMLRGIISMTDKTTDIPRKCILRLGNPSAAFAKQYPEVCPKDQLSLKIYQYEAQIELLRRVSGWEFPKDSPENRLLSALFKMEYAALTQEEISTLLRRYEGELKLLLQEYGKRGKEHKKLLVVACTLDMLIGGALDICIYATCASHLFLDEAGYASLVKALPLFAYRSPVTFLGDHMQLSPVCEWQTWESDPDNRSMLLWVESAIRADAYFAASTLQSVYDNYKQEKYPVSKYAPRLASLTQTYRFSQDLAAMLNAHIYRNGFRAANMSGNIRITVLDAPRRLDLGRRRTSSAEAEAIQAYLNKNRERLGHYVVIAPYRAQIEMLGKLLLDERRESRIMTVHKCQGQEWDTVLFSVVDTADKWFADSQNRRSRGRNLINTAISRVKKHLIIICDRAYWESQSDQLIGEIVRYAGK